MSDIDRDGVSNCRKGYDVLPPENTKTGPCTCILHCPSNKIREAEMVAAHRFRHVGGPGSFRI